MPTPQEIEDLVRNRIGNREARMRHERMAKTAQHPVLTQMRERRADVIPPAPPPAPAQASPDQIARARITANVSPAVMQRTTAQMSRPYQGREPVSPVASAPQPMTANGPVMIPMRTSSGIRLVPMPGIEPGMAPADQTNQMARFMARPNDGQRAQLRQIMSRLSPATMSSARGRQEWTMAMPAQKHAMIQNEVLQQQLNGAATMEANPQDATGMAMDSFGYDEAYYTPETNAYIRKARGKFDTQLANMMSSYDRTKFGSMEDYKNAVLALPAMKEYGGMLEGYARQKMMQAASPQVRAEFQANDMNQQGFMGWVNDMGADVINEELDKMGARGDELQDSLKGVENIAVAIYNAKDKDPAARELYNLWKSQAETFYTAVNGNVVVDQGHQLGVLEDKSMAKEKKAEQEAYELGRGRTKVEGKEKLDADVAMSQQKADLLNSIPGNEGRFMANPGGGEPIDTKSYAAEETTYEQGAIYANDYVMLKKIIAIAEMSDEEYAASLLAEMNAAKSEEQQAAVAASYYKARSLRDESDTTAIDYLKSKVSELRDIMKVEPKAGASEPATEPASLPPAEPPVAVIGPEGKPRAPAPAPTKPSGQEGTSIGVGASNQAAYEKAGEFRIGKPPDETIAEQYRMTKRVSVAYAGDEPEKIPIAVSVPGVGEYVTLATANEIEGFGKKRNVGPASPVKIRVIPVEDIADVSVSDEDLEKIRKRLRISPFANRKQILAVATDRMNKRNKRAIHPFKRLFDWTPELQWFQA